MASVYISLALYSSVEAITYPIARDMAKGVFHLLKDSSNDSINHSAENSSRIVTWINGQYHNLLSQRAELIGILTSELFAQMFLCLRFSLTNYSFYLARSPYVLLTATPLIMSSLPLAILYTIAVTGALQFLTRSLANDLPTLKIKDLSKKIPFHFNSERILKNRFVRCLNNNFLKSSLSRLNESAKRVTELFLVRSLLTVLSLPPFSPIMISACAWVGCQALMAISSFIPQNALEAKT